MAIDGQTVKPMANFGKQVLYTAEELGAAFRTFAGNTDYVIKGIGNKMSVSQNSSSLTVTVGTGEAMVCGRFVKILSNTTCTLPANQTVKVCLRVDTTKLNKDTGAIVAVTGNLKADNVNNADGQYDMLLGTAVTNSTGVTSWTDGRVIKDAAAAGMTREEIEALVRSLAGGVGIIDMNTNLASRTINPDTNPYSGKKELEWTATEDCVVWIQVIKYAWSKIKYPNTNNYITLVDASTDGTNAVDMWNGQWFHVKKNTSIKVGNGWDPKEGGFWHTDGKVYMEAYAYKK